MTDTELINWLEGLTHKGYAPNLVYDDNGYWAVSFSGVRRMIMDNLDHLSEVVSFVSTDDWKPSIREAVQHAFGNFKED